eukprot:m.895739 g.895739  ORF g.895739 m.895739 type:complete len:1300 (-) comp60000_c1_seq2:53-3952(-)
MGQHWGSTGSQQAARLFAAPDTLRGSLLGGGRGQAGEQVVVSAPRRIAHQEASLLVGSSGGSSSRGLGRGALRGRGKFSTEFVGAVADLLDGIFDVPLLSHHADDRRILVLGEVHAHLELLLDFLDAGTATANDAGVDGRVDADLLSGLGRQGGNLVLQVLLRSEDLGLVSGDLDDVGVADSVAVLVELGEVELDAELVAELLDNNTALADEGGMVGLVNLYLNAEAAKNAVSAILLEVGETGSQGSLGGIDVGAETLQDDRSGVLGGVGHLDVDVEVGHQLADRLSLGSDELAVELGGEGEVLGLGHQRQELGNRSIHVRLKTLDDDHVGAIGSSSSSSSIGLGSVIGRGALGSGLGGVLNRGSGGTSSRSPGAVSLGGLRGGLANTARELDVDVVLGADARHVLARGTNDESVVLSGNGDSLGHLRFQLGNNLADLGYSLGHELLASAHNDGLALAREVDHHTKFVGEILEDLAGLLEEVAVELGGHIDGGLDDVLELLHARQNGVLGGAAGSFLADNRDHISVLVLSSGEDDAHASRLLQLGDGRALLANDEAVECLLDGHLEGEAVEGLLVGKLQQGRLGLLDISTVAADGDLGGGLVLGEGDVHTTVLSHDVLDDLSLGPNEGVVVLGIHIDGLGDNVGLFGLDLEDLVAGSLAVLLGTGDLDDGVLSAILGDADAGVSLLLDQAERGAGFADDELDELGEQRHLQRVVGLDQALDLVLEMLLGRIHVLLVTTQGDDVGNILGGREVERNAAKLLDEQLDVGTLGTNELRVELLVDDHIHGLGVGNLLQGGLDDGLGLGNASLGSLDADDVGDTVIGRHADVDIVLLLDLADVGTLLSDEVAEECRVALDLSEAQTRLEIVDLRRQDRKHLLGILGGALDLDGIVVAKVDVDLGVAVVDLLDVGTLGSNEVAVQPVGRLEGQSNLRLGKGVDHGEGLGQARGLAAQSHDIAVALSSRELDVHVGGGKDGIEVAATGAADELVLGLVDGHGKLAACLALGLVDRVDLSNSARNAKLLATDNDLVLDNVVGRQVDADAVGLGNALGVDRLRASNQGMERLDDRQTHNVHLGLLIRHELDLLDSIADVVGGADDGDESGGVVALGDLDDGRGRVHQLLHNLALLANEERVVVLGNIHLSARLGLELLQEGLLGLLDVVTLAGDADAQGAVLAQVQLDLGVGLARHLAADAVLLGSAAEHVLVELAVALLLDGHGKHLGDGAGLEEEGRRHNIDGLGRSGQLGEQVRVRGHFRGGLFVSHGRVRVGGCQVQKSHGESTARPSKGGGSAAIYSASQQSA